MNLSHSTGGITAVLFSGIALATALNAQAADTCSLIPPLPASATVTSWVNPGPGLLVQSYLDVTLSDGPTLTGGFDAWCVDTVHTMVDHTPFDVTPICSYAPAAGPYVDKPENLDLVNWLLNQVYKGEVIGKAASCGGDFTYGDVQRAIWALIADTQATGGLGTEGVDWLQCRADELVTRAEGHDGFVPGCEDFVGVLLIPADRQRMIIMLRAHCDDKPGTCARVTGGGKQLRPLTYSFGVAGDVEAVTHGGQVGAPVGVETIFWADSPCIRGEWEHVRHYAPGLKGNFHARSFDSLMAVCLDEGYGAGAVVGELCNPGDRVSGPEPRKAPANKICFSGVGNYAIEKGKRAQRSVLFRVDIEDRSEPGNSKKVSENPPDRYRIRIWVLTDAELAKLADPLDQLQAFRFAIACTPESAATRDGADVPNGTAVFGVRAPDIDDGGELNDGNHQIHPCIKDCP